VKRWKRRLKSEGKRISDEWETDGEDVRLRGATEKREDTRETSNRDITESCV
jgi:hypothetical protein